MNALSHTTGYAILALSYVGCGGKAWVQAGQIAGATGIPKPYLSKILHELGKSGVIRTKRGTGGGVALSKPADQLSLLDVARAVEPLATEPRCCLGMATCSDKRPCPMHAFWTKVRQQVREQLARITLAQAADHLSVAGFKARPIEDFLEDLALPARLYKTKPTGRFMRKFGVKQ